MYVTIECPFCEPLPGEIAGTVETFYSRGEPATWSDPGEPEGFEIGEGECPKCHAATGGRNYNDFHAAGLAAIEDRVG